MTPLGSTPHSPEADVGLGRGIEQTRQRVRHLQEVDGLGPRLIAAALNAEGIERSNGKRWTRSVVRKVQKSLAIDDDLRRHYESHHPGRDRKAIDQRPRRGTTDPSHGAGCPTCSI